MKVFRYVLQLKTFTFRRLSTGSIKDDVTDPHVFLLDNPNVQQSLCKNNNKRVGVGFEDLEEKGWLFH